MKNKKLISASMFSGFLVLIALMVFNVDLLLRNNTNINNLLFDEVEALADGEYGSGNGKETVAYSCSMEWDPNYAIVIGCRTTDNQNSYCDYEEPCPEPSTDRYCFLFGHQIDRGLPCLEYCQRAKCKYEYKYSDTCGTYSYFKTQDGSSTNYGTSTRTIQ